MIARFYDATEGEVKINGRNVKEYNIESLRNYVAVVMQKALLFKGSIRDNMKWGKKDATDDEIMEALDISQSREFVEKKDGKLTRLSTREERTFLVVRDSVLLLPVQW